MQRVHKCPICSSVVSERHIYGLKDFQLGHAGTFDLKKCTHCLHSYLSPRPAEDEIFEFYKGTYYTHSESLRLGGGDADFALPLAPRHLLLKHLLAKVDNLKNLIAGRSLECERPHGNGRVLDIGCGSGLLLSRLQRNGWRVFGYEPDVDARKAAQTLLPSAQVFSSLEAVRSCGGEFELVTLSHVIEHVHDPVEMIRFALECCGHNGRVIIRTPDIACLEARVFGRYWRGLEAPRHLHLFCMNSLVLAIEKAGGYVVNASREGLPAALVESIEIVLREKLGVDSGVFLRALLRALYAVYWPLCFALRRIGVSSSMEIAVRREPA